MFKVLTTYTYELDNPEKAAQEILAQIDIKNNLLKNSVALLFCHTKFIEMGVMEAVCKSLPFDVVGCTSLFFAVSGQTGDSVATDGMMLTVTVLTSDDVEFAVSVSEPLTEANGEEHIQTLYRNTAASLGARPELVFAFPPTQLNLTIDVMSAALDRACGGVPIFGTVALDMVTHIRNPLTIHRGAAYSDRMALLLFKGPVKPRFFSIRFPKKSILTQDAVITGAEGSRIHTINNMPATSFLKELGLMQNSAESFVSAIPLIIEDGEGKNPRVVVVQDITPEGTLICSRQVPVGKLLKIGASTADMVLTGASTLFQNIAEKGNGAGLLVFSCFLRSVTLGEGAIAEVQLLQQVLGSNFGPWLYLSSGGELCPANTGFGETVNQALQYALIACQF
jgi:hypothetical protein